MKPTLPIVLSLTAGFVDTAGFLALHGLFTAHVTGNFVTLAAALVLGTSGAVTKLLSLPVFCAGVLLARLLGDSLRSRRLAVLPLMLLLMLGLLAVAAILALQFGPFTDSDSWPAMATGMTLVTAMAIQNAGHRTHLPDTPPSTLMTGTTTQIMIDLADVLYGASSDATTAARSRIARMSVSVAAFAVGCGTAAITYAFYGMWCFLAPPALALIALHASTLKSIQRM